MRQHVKTKDRAKQEKLRAINASSERKLMPRPAVFRDRSKYDRKSSKHGMRQMLAAY